MSKLAFLDGEDAVETPMTAETPAEAPAEAPSPETPVRDEHGRFAPKAGEASEKPAEASPSAEAPPAAPEAPAIPPVAAEAAPAPVETPKPPDVDRPPLTALLDERDKRKAAEQRAQETERQLAELQRAQAQSAAPPPSVFDDEEGFYAHQQQQQAQALLSVRFDVSEQMARDKHGDEAVNTAWEAARAKAQQSPAFMQELITNRHPIDFAVKWHQREQLVSEVADVDPEAFKAWKASLNAPQPAAQTAASAAPSPTATPPPPQSLPTPPKDITAAPSAGGVSSPGQVGPGTSFGALFKG